MIIAAVIEAWKSHFVFYLTHRKRKKYIFFSQDNEKISALHEEREKKVQELEVHIDRMRNQHDQLQKKLKDEADRKSKMEKEMQKQQQKIKELEDHTNQQQKVLKRKTEEVAAAKRRLRNFNQHGNEAEKER